MSGHNFFELYNALVLVRYATSKMVLNNLYILYKLAHILPMFFYLLFGRPKGRICAITKRVASLSRS